MGYSYKLSAEEAKQKCLCSLGEGNIEEFNRYRALMVPKKIYKFISFKGLSDKDVGVKLQTIRDNRIWCNSASDENDSFELKALYSDVSKLDQSRTTQLLSKKIEGFIKGLPACVAICSFTSEDYSNLKMWSDYGSEGICVEYEVVDPSRLFPVFYEKSIIDFSKIIGYMSNTAQAAYGKKDVTAIREMDVYYTLCAQVLNIKQDIWSSEKEIRAVVPCDDKGCNIECGQVGISALNIYLSPKLSKSYEQSVCDVAREAHVGCCSLYASQTSYRLNPVRLVEQTD